MRLAQGIIKFFALCLAGVIIIGMFGVVIGGVAWLGRLADGENGWTSEDIETIWSGESTDAQVIKKLVIKTGATNTRLVQGDSANFKIDTNNKYISSRQIGNTLYIEEESHFIFSSFFDDGDLVITVPRTIVFNELEINVGAGAFWADEINTKSLDLEVGAGKTTIDELIVTEDAHIDGGAGLIEINGGKMRDVQLKLGAGKTQLRSEISGNSKIEAGVGKLELNLLGSKSRYKFEVDKGIGSVTIDGASQSDDAVYGQGDNKIKLESGVGAVEVSFVD